MDNRTHPHTLTNRGHAPSSSTPGARRARGTNRHFAGVRLPGVVSITMRFGRASSGSWLCLRCGTELTDATRGSNAAKESAELGVRSSRLDCIGSRSPGLVPCSWRGPGGRENPGINDIVSRFVAVGGVVGVVICAVDVVYTRSAYSIYT